MRNKGSGIFGCCFSDLRPLTSDLRSLFLHLFPFNIRCWTFDPPCSRPSRQVFDVHFFLSLLGKNNLALMGFRGSEVHGPFVLALCPGPASTMIV